MVAASKAGKFAETGADCEDAPGAASVKVIARRRVSVTLGISYLFPMNGTPTPLTGRGGLTLLKQ
jgi:hypothetical protein